MSIVQNTSAASFVAADPATSATKKAAEDPTDRFLKLLVTQMKNQDPLNPLDNAQITSQMAQISTVSGINKLNATRQNMAASFSANQSLQVANMIGRGVLVPGSTMQLADGKAIGGVDLLQSVDQLTITIRDAAGAIVHSMDLGPKPGGIAAFAWDGATDSGSPAANGIYSFSVSALQGGKKVDGSTLSFGQVNSVTPGKDGMSLDVSGGLGTINVTDVKKIL